MLKVFLGLVLATPVVLISSVAWGSEIAENDDLAQVTGRVEGGYYPALLSVKSERATFTALSFRCS